MPGRKRTLFVYHCSVLFLLCLSIHEACGEESSSDSHVYIMEEIVVTGGPHDTVSDVVLEKERFHTRRWNTAAEILRNAPGASVTVGAKNSSEIMIRGFLSRDVLIMVDGRPMNDPYYGKLDLSTLGAGNVEKIRVVKGPSSVRYGPNAMGGVVNIVTGDFDDGPSLEMNSTVGYGKDLRADIIHRGKVRGIGYRFHLGRNTHDGYPLSRDFQPTSMENGNLRDNSDYHRTDLNAKLFFVNTDSQKWNLGISHSHLTKGLPASVYEARYWRFKRWDHTAFDVTGEMSGSESFRVKTNLYLERFINELVDYRDDSYDPENIYWDSTHDNRSAGLLVSSSYRPGENGVSNAGIQLRWDESNRQADTNDDWFVNRTTTTWIFLDHERSITANLLLRGGLSGHLFTYDSWDKTAQSINPSVHLEWLVGNCILTGSFSRVSRFPTLHHLYSHTSGNRELDPEWAYKGEIALSRTFNDVLKLSATGFISRVHDMIYRSGRLNKYHNIENASLDGAEIGGLLSTGKFVVRSDLLLLSAHDGDGRELEYRPRWKIDSSIDYLLNKKIRLYLTSRFVGRRRSETGTEMNPYHVTDTGIVLEGKRSLSLTVKMENIFDVDYEEEYGYPMEGRILRIGMDFHWDRNRE